MIGRGGTSESIHALRYPLKDRAVGRKAFHGGGGNASLLSLPSRKEAPLVRCDRSNSLECTGLGHDILHNTPLVGDIAVFIRRVCLVIPRYWGELQYHARTHIGCQRVGQVTANNHASVSLSSDVALRCDAAELAGRLLGG